MVYLGLWHPESRQVRTEIPAKNTRERWLGKLDVQYVLELKRLVLPCFARFFGCFLGTSWSLRNKNVLNSSRCVKWAGGGMPVGGWTGGQDPMLHMPSELIRFKVLTCLRHQMHDMKVTSVIWSESGTERKVWINGFEVWGGLHYLMFWFNKFVHRLSWQQVAAGNTAIGGVWNLRLRCDKVPRAVAQTVLVLVCCSPFFEATNWESSKHLLRFTFFVAVGWVFAILMSLTSFSRRVAGFSSKYLNLVADLLISWMSSIQRIYRRDQIWIIGDSMVILKLPRLAPKTLFEAKQINKIKQTAFWKDDGNRKHNLVTLRNDAFEVLIESFLVAGNQKLDPGPVLPALGGFQNMFSDLCMFMYCIWLLVSWIQMQNWMKYS